jgi:hypothetical protein
MAAPSAMQRVVSCVCGRVRFGADGAPMSRAVCYCDDCQAGARLIEALPNAPRFRDDDGGTSFLTYRDDRFKCLSGEDLLVAYRIKEGSPTRRMIASCCNSAIYLKFEPGFWVSIYRERLESDDLPPPEMRIQTKYRRADAPLPDLTPCYRGIPLRLFVRGVFARIAMAVGA